jgi:hypothetical protein
MNTVLLDFNTRAQEVDDYFIFLHGLIKQTTKLAVAGSAGQYQLDISNNCQTFSPLGFLSEARSELRTRN